MTNSTPDIPILDNDAEAEPDHCHWQSRRLGARVKVWDTGCGDVRERLPDELCPTCGKRVWLTGFDAWWEARKSYHP